MATIQPTDFDLIVLGTGLQEALLAGAAAQAGKSVLHLDAAGSYGSHWASHRLDGLLEWAAAQQQRRHPSEGGRHQQQQQQPAEQTAGGAGQFGAPPHREASSIAAGAAADAAAATPAEGVGTSPEQSTPGSDRQSGGVSVSPEGAKMYSHVRVWRREGADLGPERDYNIDLAPKVAFCAGPMVKTLLDSGAHNYMEFKALQASYVWQHGRLVSVPATRSDIFAAAGLSLPQRRTLTRFLTSASAAMEGSGPLKDAFDGRPFAQLLAEQGLGPDVRSLLLYAVALLERDQEPGPQNPTPIPITAIPAAALAAASASGTSASAAAALPPSTAAAAAAAPCSAASSGHAPTAASSPTAPASSTYGTAGRVEAAQEASAGSQHEAGITTSAPSAGASETDPASQPEIDSVSQQEDTSDAALEAAAEVAADVVLHHSEGFGGGVATAADGLQALRLYMQSAGKYGAGTGAFLLPCYGTSELPQAFCRVAAVAGALYVLRCPVDCILLNPAGGDPASYSTDGIASSAATPAALAGSSSQAPQVYSGGGSHDSRQNDPSPSSGGHPPPNGGSAQMVSGVHTSDGQTLTCRVLAGDVDAFAGFSTSRGGSRTSGGGVARAVAIIDRPLLQGVGTALAVFPPGSLPSGNSAAVRVLQVGPSTNASPPGRYLLHVSSPAGGAATTPTSTVAAAASSTAGSHPSPLRAGAFNAGRSRRTTPPQEAAPLGQRDVEEAVAVLAQLPLHWQQGTDAGAQREARSLVEQQQQQQQQQQQTALSASEQRQSADAARQEGEAGDDGSSRPRVLLLASYVQSTEAPDAASLPANTVCSSPPDGSLDFRSALEAAQGAFAHLLPEEAARQQGALFGRPPAEPTAAEGGEGMQNGVADGDDDSDDDALAALEAALQGIGGSGSPASAPN